MADKFIIRKAKTRDLEGVLRLNLELFKKEYREFDKSLDLNWTYKRGKKYFRDRIVKKDGFVEVIENKGEIIGYLCGGITRGLFYRKKSKYAEMEDMLIEKKFRSKGLGTKLTRDFINWCKNNKVNYISATASVENKSAINFYKNLGFEEYNLTLERKFFNNK